VKAEWREAISASEAETRKLGARLAAGLTAGAVVLLEGQLGAGKTTFVRGVLEALGHHGPVRSPTFNLIQSFTTNPPVMHADLYRVSSYHGIGLEDYMDTHVCLIEWPDRALGLTPEEGCWRVEFTIEGLGRRIRIRPPLQP